MKTNINLKCYHSYWPSFYNHLNIAVTFYSRKPGLRCPSCHQVSPDDLSTGAQAEQPRQATPTVWCTLRCSRHNQHTGPQYTFPSGKYSSTKVPNIPSLQASISAPRSLIYLPCRQVKPVLVGFCSYFLLFWIRNLSLT